MGHIAVLPHSGRGRLAGIAGIGAEVLDRRHARVIRQRRDHPALQQGGHLGNVMAVRPGDDERQRDATAVHLKMPLASFFFPDPSGWGRRLLGPRALSSSPHRRLATPRQRPPLHHTRPAPSATRPEKSPERSRCGNSGGWPWDSRISPSATRSTGCPCAKRTRSRQTPDAPAAASVRRPAAAGTLDRGPVAVGGPGAPPSPRTHRTPPNTPSSAWSPPGSACRPMGRWGYINHSKAPANCQLFVDKLYVVFAAFLAI